MSKKSLKEVLTRYDSFAKIEMQKFIRFQAEARRRIVAGHKIYGDDWKDKDNIAEIEFERLDIYNYTILDKMQKERNRGNQEK